MSNGGTIAIPPVTLPASEQEMKEAIFLQGFFTSHGPTRGSCQDVSKKKRVERRRVRRCLKYHGTGRVGSGRVGSGYCQSRGSGRVALTRPDP